MTTLKNYLRKIFILDINNLSVSRIIVLAVLLKIIIIPFYFHPDIKTYHFQVSFFKSGVWDIYSYLQSNKEHLPRKEEFVYLPLTYIFLGSYQTIVSPLLGNDFNKWLFDASSQSSDTVGLYRYLFILKFPYLIFDIGSGLIILMFFEKTKQRKRALIYWLFNPFSNILIYIYGNIDIIPVFLSVTSILLFTKNKIVLPSILLALGAGFKAYPILFLPYLLTYKDRLTNKLTALFLSIAIFLLIIFPFMHSESFRQSTLSSGLTTRILDSGLTIGFDEKIFPIILICSIIFFFNLINSTNNRSFLVSSITAVLLTVYAFIHFHIQWLLWVIPFLVIIAVEKEKQLRSIVIILTVALLIPWLYEDKYMTVSLLKSINPLYDLLPTPFSLVQRFYDPTIIQSALHSIFAGGSIVLLWQLFKGESKT